MLSINQKILEPIAKPASWPGKRLGMFFMETTNEKYDSYFIIKFLKLPLDLNSTVIS